MGAFDTTECLYEMVEDHIKIVACRGFDSVAVIPETIEGLPVTELAPYAFSQWRREPLRGVWSKGGGRESTGNESAKGAPGLLDTPPLLEGNRLVELHIPRSLAKIGAYAFYNCEKWERFFFYSTLTDIGAGVFTGCKALNFLDITVEPGKKSGMQEILFELCQRIRVTYHGEGTARLVFPQFYEEAIENTPARILETRTHGCGHRYRYCFYESQFQFEEYDAQLYNLTVQEPVPIVIEVALGRLQYPYRLSDVARRSYSDYLEGHKSAALDLVIENNDMEQLKWFVGAVKPGHQELEAAVDTANRLKRTEALSFLMDYRHEHFKPQKRKFAL